MSILWPFLKESIKKWHRSCDRSCDATCNLLVPDRHLLAGNAWQNAWRLLHAQLEECGDEERKPMSLRECVPPPPPRHPHRPPPPSPPSSLRGTVMDKVKVRGGFSRAHAMCGSRRKKSSSVNYCSLIGVSPRGGPICMACQGGVLTHDGERSRVHGVVTRWRSGGC